MSKASAARAAEPKPSLPLEKYAVIIRIRGTER